MLRGTLAWLPMPVIAIGNAALRELALQPAFGAAAQPASGITLAVLLALYAFVMFRRLIGGAARWAAWLLGGIWAALTLGFEYALIASQQPAPLARLFETLSPTTIAEGNLFALAVLAVLLAPPLFTRPPG
ncbi:hypothetical protein [Dichotomicrobium thermohalophilum]|uniref:Uncharacterized protein n=1 Tax=Dichotomicrobium thermohalophilum TaxID=933063 RepID=A0A397Q6J3_9HYPH|nr:hypothetical protein [Dichotomicrobium thermohalophilum]RIA56089.1 hypothetical protein BXY53_1186 [Dichotomicrobium thermohalophilum]